MVKIYYCSDLHLELEDDTYELFIDDVYSDSYLVLAGDICQYRKMDRLKLFLNKLSKKFKRIIYVPGNHEYYFSELSDDLGRECVKNIKNVYLLQNESVVFDDDEIMFYGTTLWSRISYDNMFQYLAMETSINDYQSIKLNDRLIKSNDTTTLFEKYYSDLKLFLDDNSNSKYKKIVVTHHLPLMELIHEKYKKFKYNNAFATDLRDEIKELDFDYWICGHTHETMNYEMQLRNKKAYFVCNPKGYKNENSRFTKDSFILV